MSRTLLRPVAVSVVSVFPDFGALGGLGPLRAVIGALLTVVLITAVLMLIVSAITWAMAASHGNYQAASRARTGLLVACGTAALAGFGIAWLNFLIGIGSHL